MPSRPRLRALVLAAGLGTRLRPLTERVPKPALPVCGTPILGHTLSALAAAGCEAAAINLHHRGEVIRRALGDRWQGLPLTYSEEPEILGTLGALAPLRSFLEAADLVLLVNGDSLCRWPFDRLIAHHLARSAAVTLLLATRPNVTEFGGGVGVDGQGRVVSFRSSGDDARHIARRAVFAGAHVLAPSLLEEVAPHPSDIVRNLYEPRLAKGEVIHSLSTTRSWHDLGSPERYRLGVLDWAKGPWVSKEARIEKGASVTASVVEAGAFIETGAVVRDSVILPGAHIGRAAVIQRCVVGFGTAVPALARAHERLVAVAEAAEDAEDGDA